jgi:hypothetical protein
MRVNTTVIHNTYVDNTIVRNNTIVNDRHVAFSGGPGGINHPPTPDENRYSHEQHVAPTAYQTRQESAARTNVNNYASHNGGHPANVATERPMVGGPRNNGGGEPNGAHGLAGSPSTNHGNNPGSNPGAFRSSGGNHSTPESRPMPESRPEHESRPAPQSHAEQPHGGGGGGGEHKGH